jgi:hypothetical protein
MYAKSPRGLRATWGPDGAPSVCSGRGALPSYGIGGRPYKVEGGLRIGAVLLEVCLLRRVVGEGSLCGYVVEGFLALFCGGSLGGPSAAFCGVAVD